MPTYIIKDNETGHEQQILMRISEMEELLKTNPSKSLVHRGAAATVSGVAHGKNKPDDSFRDILRTIKKNNRRSTIDTY